MSCIEVIKKIFFYINFSFIYLKFLLIILILILIIKNYTAINAFIYLEFHQKKILIFKLHCMKKILLLNLEMDN